MQAFYASRRAAATLRADASSEPFRPFHFIETIEQSPDVGVTLRRWSMTGTEAQARQRAELRLAQLAAHPNSSRIGVQVFRDSTPVYFAGGAR